jgi:hypothetical protein
VSARREGLVIAGLLLLSAVPALGGVLRVVSTLLGADWIPGQDRVTGHEWALGLHVLSSALFATLGAFQFSSRLRRARTRWHGRAGRILVPAGLLSAGSGGWLTAVYPLGEHDGTVLTMLRVAVVFALTVALFLGTRAARNREFRAHGAWMMRAYALAQGAGTQVFTHLLLLDGFGMTGETARTLAMGGGWAINLAVAEGALLASRRPMGPARGPRPVPGAVG